MSTHAALKSHHTAGEAVVARTAWMAPHRDEPLRTVGTVIDVPEGQEICAEGNDADTFYKVVSGVVRVCKFLSDGRRQIEAFHVEGELFGIELGDERLLSAEAVTACKLVVYRRRNVEQLAKNDHAVSHQMFNYAMQSLARAQNHSLLLGRRGAAEKVAAFLLDWTAKTTGKGNTHLAMSRQDIADYLGLTIETVSRSMSQFERDGVIGLAGPRQVQVLKRAALEHLAA